MTSQHPLAGRTLDFGALLFGDRFRFVGDGESVSYGPVVRTQDFVHGSFSVETGDGRDFFRNSFVKVFLLHRAPDCACGAHIDYCVNGCQWPDELEDLWQSLYGS